MWPIGDLQTTDGRRVEVIDPGLHNQNAGPDFFNAKVKINGIEWAGNVEIHDRSSHWYQHGHDKDEHYNNVVLHVVGEADRDVQTLEGHFVPQMVLQVPPSVLQNYEELLKTDQYPPCYKIIPTLTPLVIHSWMAALQTERLEQKTIAILQRVKERDGSWEEAYFQTLARNYGFGINGDAFEEWARHIPLSAVGKHRDDLFQIEAIFMGQAGLLELEAIPDYYQQTALNEGYFAKLRNEYLYLAHKFSMKPMEYKLCSHVTPYWETHYTFGSTSNKNEKHLSYGSLNLLMINTAIPMLFAVGRHRGKEVLCDKAFDFLEQLKAENNYIIRMWQQVGLPVQTAGDSQALIQLKKEYCDKRDCLRCRFGYEYLKR